MRFSAKEDIGGPAEAVFAALSDFETFERMALRKGADVRRTDMLRIVGPGMSWRVGFTLRGRPRTMDIVLRSYVAPERMTFDAVSPNLSMTGQIEVLALSRNRARLTVTMEVRPRTLTARLLMQSARLARKRLNRRYTKRVRDLAANIEARLQKAGGETPTQWRRGSAG